MVAIRVQLWLFGSQCIEVMPEHMLCRGLKFTERFPVSLERAGA